MPAEQRKQVDRVVEELGQSTQQGLHSLYMQGSTGKKRSRMEEKRFRIGDLEVSVLRVDASVRLLFTETEDGILIVDIVDRRIPVANSINARADTAQF